MAGPLMAQDQAPSTNDNPNKQETPRRPVDRKMTLARMPSLRRKRSHLLPAGAAQED